jgi:hypothetical protein
LLHGTDALAFPKDGSLIYKLLGPEQQDDFARGWGVSYGAGSLMEPPAPSA